MGELGTDSDSLPIALVMVTPSASKILVAAARATAMCGYGHRPVCPCSCVHDVTKLQNTLRQSRM